MSFKAISTDHATTVFPNLFIFLKTPTSSSFLAASCLLIYLQNLGHSVWLLFSTQIFFSPHPLFLLCCLLSKATAVLLTIFFSTSKILSHACFFSISPQLLLFWPANKFKPMLSFNKPFFLHFDSLRTINLLLFFGVININFTTSSW